MLTQQLATAFSGSTLRNSTWLGSHTVLIFAPLGALHHLSSLSGRVLGDRAALKTSRPNQLGTITLWEQSPGLEATYPVLQEQSFVVARRISGESLAGTSADVLKCSWECHITLWSSAVQSQNPGHDACSGHHE